MRGIINVPHDKRVGYIAELIICFGFMQVLSVENVCLAIDAKCQMSFFHTPFWLGGGEDVTYVGSIGGRLLSAINRACSSSHHPSRRSASSSFSGLVFIGFFTVFLWA